MRVGATSFAALFVMGCGLIENEATRTKIDASKRGAGPVVAASPTATPATISEDSRPVFPLAVLTITAGGETKNCVAGLFAQGLVTAAHCLNQLSERACNDGTLKIRWYAIKDGLPDTLGAEGKCASFVYDKSLDPKNDFALIKLGEGGRKPEFVLNFAEKDVTSGGVMLFGPPSQDGLIRTGTGTILAVTDQMITHRAYHGGGASGSPVLILSRSIDSPINRENFDSAVKAGVIGLHVGAVGGLTSAIPVGRVKSWVESQNL